MGLDAVELVLAVEVGFDIEIDPSDASKTGRVEELLDLIIDNALEQNGEALLRQDVAAWLIDYLVKEHGISRDKIYPESRFFDDLDLN